MLIKANRDAQSPTEQAIFAVLLVLDDVWVASHVVPLNFIVGATYRSAVVVTTRLRGPLGGAAGSLYATRVMPGKQAPRAAPLAALV